MIPLPDDDEPDTRWDTQAAKDWAMVMAMNLPMPLGTAWLVYEVHTRDKLLLALGMMIALATILIAGCYFSGFRWLVFRRIAEGGVILAVTQFVPLLQFLGVIFGILFWEWTVRPHVPKEPAVRVLEGYVATFAAAQFLMFIAYITGLIFRKADMLGRG